MAELLNWATLPLRVLFSMRTAKLLPLMWMPAPRFSVALLWMVLWVRVKALATSMPPP